MVYYLQSNEASFLFSTPTSALSHMSHVANVPTHFNRNPRSCLMSQTSQPISTKTLSLMSHVANVPTPFNRNSHPCLMSHVANIPTHISQISHPHVPCRKHPNQERVKIRLSQPYGFGIFPPLHITCLLTACGDSLRLQLVAGSHFKVRALLKRCAYASLSLFKGKATSFGNSELAGRISAASTHPLYLTI
jgi:hypothetical protein